MPYFFFLCSTNRDSSIGGGVMSIIFIFGKCAHTCGELTIEIKFLSKSSIDTRLDRSASFVPNQIA